MGRSRLPWFKVQANLPKNPKFRRLPVRLQGQLLALWCCAACQDDRGTLPKAAEIADFLGHSYPANSARIEPRILIPLTKAGFLDKVGDWYRIHDWQYWQAVDSTGLVRTDYQSDYPADYETDYPGVAAKEVKPEISCAREIEREKTTYPSDKSCGISSLFPDFEPENIKGHAKSNGGDPRLGPLKEHIAAEWERERGCSISSAASKADWTRLADMLRRSRNDSSYSLAGLKVSFTRFVCDRDRFIRSQGLAYWSRNAYRWLPDSLSQSVSSGKAVRSRGNVSLMADWWRDEGNG